MPEERDDPVVRSSRREALMALLIYLSAMLYTVLYCHFNGYRRPPETMTLVLGFPDWVVWGILLPWFICIVLSFWFGHIFMRDAELEQSAEEADEDGERRNA